MTSTIDQRHPFEIRQPLYWLLIFLFLLPGCTVKPIRQGNQFPGSKLTVLQLQFLQDDSGRLNIDQLVTAAVKPAFADVTTTVPSFGFTESPIWGRFVLRSPVDSTAVVEISSSRLDLVDWYEVRAGRVTHHVAYDASCAGQHAATTYPSLRVKLNSAEQVTVYCRIRSLGGSLTIPILTCLEDEYIEADLRRRYVAAIQIGATAGLILLCFLLGHTLRDWTFIFLGLAAFSTLTYSSLFDNVASLPSVQLPAMATRFGADLAAMNTALMMLLFAVSWAGRDQLSRSERWSCYLAVGCLLGFVLSNTVLPHRVLRGWVGPVIAVVILAQWWIFSRNWRNRPSLRNLLTFVGILLVHVPPILSTIQLHGYIPVAFTPPSLRLASVPVVLAGLCILLIGRRNSLDQLQLAAALSKSREAESRLLALRYQLNPHMLMNSLTAVSWLATESPRRIPRFIENLSSILQSRLRPSGNQFWTVTKELQLAQSLLELATVRFDDRLQYVLQIAPEAAECLVPEMLMQPLVENAIKYTPVDTQTATISIAARIQHSRLMLTVANPVRGGTIRNVQESLKIGHANIQQRLDILYRDSADFRFTTDETEVVAQLDLPIRI